MSFAFDCPLAPAELGTREGIVQRAASRKNPAPRRIARLPAAGAVLAAGVVLLPFHFFSLFKERQTQDRYVGDRNDFVKFFLLRKLLAVLPDAKLGICWYKTNPDQVDGQQQQNDGGHIGYLDQENNWRWQADGELFQKLREIVHNQRTITAVEQPGIFPPGTLYYQAEVPQVPGNQEQYLQARANWANQARMALAQATLVFLDPDNAPHGHFWLQPQNGGKWASPEEVREFFGQGRTTIFISHPPHVHRLQHHQQMAAMTGQVGAVFCSLYQGNCGFHFLVAPQHRRCIPRLLQELALQGQENGWGTWRYADANGVRINLPADGGRRRRRPRRRGA